MRSRLSAIMTRSSCDRKGNRRLQTSVTTVWPRQGHYALDERTTARYPAPDVTLRRVTDLQDWIETLSLLE